MKQTSVREVSLHNYTYKIFQRGLTNNKTIISSLDTIALEIHSPVPVLGCLF